METSTIWKDSSLLKTLESRSFIALPFSVDENRKFGLLLVGDQVMETYPQSEMYLQRFVRQLARGFNTILALQSTRSHLHEISLLLDFSRKLAGLDTRSILKTLLENIFPVITNAQAGWIGLWDEESQNLQVEYANGYVSDKEIIQLNFALMGNDYTETQSEPLVSRIFRLGHPKCVSEIRFSRDYNLPKEDLMCYRKALGSKLPLSSILVPIFSGTEKIGILVLDNFEASQSLNEQDLELAEAMLSQVSLALENAKLFVDVEQRSAQLKGLTQAAEIMTSSLQRDELIKTLLEQLSSILPFETATLWLRERNNLSIADARGFEDNESRVGIEVQIEDSRLFQEMIQTGQALLVGDVREDERFLAMIEPENFSWLGIPLLSQSEVIGLIALEKKEANYYTADHVLAGTTLASQAAVSLENARIFEESLQRSDELDQRSRRLSLLNELSSVLNATLNADEIIHDSIEKLFASLDISRILYVSRQSDNEFSLKKEYPVFEGGMQMQPFGSPLLEHLNLSQGIFNTFDIEYETGFDQTLEDYFSSRKVRSLLIVPILTASDLFGWLFLCREELTRFSQAEIDLLRTIGNQVAIALQNANLYLTTNQMTDELEQRVNERTAELQIEHKNTQTLLSIITELSSSMEIDEVLSNTLAILNQSTGSEQSVVLMADGTSRTFDNGEKLIKVDRLGDIFSIFPEQEVAGWVLQNRETAVSDDIIADSRWNFGTRLQIDFDYSSLLAVPLILGNQVLGTLFLAHTEKEFFSPDILNLVEASARQISIAINNAELFDLSQDQSDRLFDMLRDQQIDSSRSVAILEAVADGVLVTDATDTISLFNVSAERILDLTANQVVGQPLSKFAGLFGSSSDRWLKTIEKWSDAPMLAEDGETYAEQIELDNGHIVLVHLAPVILGENFLGTVSIFRDITQEVLVDRLKSDFVANVSHELRTPMTSIKGYVEILLMGAAGELDEQQKGFLTVIKENTERLKVLVDDLLDISYIEAGKTKLTFEAFDLKAIIEESLTEMRKVSQSENRPIDFSLQQDGDIPLVYGDVEKIRQVVDSLVKNGYIYTPENGKVRVNVKALDEKVQVDVIDNGIGISPENHERIFERSIAENTRLFWHQPGQAWVWRFRRSWWICIREKFGLKARELMEKEVFSPSRSRFLRRKKHNAKNTYCRR